MIIAVHRWGGGDVKKVGIFITEIQSLTTDNIYKYTMKKLLTILALTTLLSGCYISEYATDAIYSDRNLYYRFHPYYYNFYYMPVRPYYIVPRYTPRHQQPRTNNFSPQPNPNQPNQAPIRRFSPRRSG